VGQNIARLQIIPRDERLEVHLSDAHRDPERFSGKVAQ
jgi:hypothetical protein